MTDTAMTNTAALAAEYRAARAKRARRAGLLKHIFLIATSLIMVYPLIWMLASSLKPDNQIFGDLSLWPSRFEWSNYWQGWNALPVSFTRFFWNSTVVTVLSVIGNVISCSFAAYAFARLEFTGKTIWFALMMMTLMIPYHVVLIPQYLLFLNLGWVDTYLPLIVPKFLAGDAFFVFLMIQFFRQLPRDLDEAAMIDGCSPFKIYWAIIMPLSLPAMATAAIFSFIWSWEDFLGPLVYLNDMNDYTVPLALRMFTSQDSVSQYGPMFAMSILSILPIVIFFVIFQRMIIQGIAMSGLK
ncbi:MULTISPECIES: carbohydrate ABC transporter permease [Devosia]|jgi:multiple sugar transport system permease protein|uniref:Carbohydrate ABC transporter permease n=2 Tax=Devosia TaxID=46913 RepID=A0A942E8F5_9HYPH|nr:carbohydrate ABC transporter permease [Devosia litorisediminis]|tara:strand:+ start:19646 stop:20539 length:894 start_codon:yes stop_codon:yes gene_type:complete